MSTLERAIEIAARAHTGQFTPDREPYILHPLRMMLTFHTPNERVVAVLHDVVEKSDIWTIERLRLEGFSSTVLEAVEALTKRSGEEFSELVERARPNLIATHIKRADIGDHLKYFADGNTEKYLGGLAMLQEENP